MQKELTSQGLLLNEQGKLAQVGWSRRPLLTANLEASRFYRWRAWQRFRIKRWDYYAIFTPQRFFSATIADLGYAGNIFIYTLDFATGDLHEEGLVIPLGKGITLPVDSTSGESHFVNERVKLVFQALLGKRTVAVDWPAFHGGKGIHAELSLICPPQHESMNIVIPIGSKRFYYNTKINCLPAQGLLQYGEIVEHLDPQNCLGSLDWGRGVWEYSSYWNWASASGFLPDGRTVGLNLGCGFGDLSAATENCLVLDGRIHKLAQVKFDYISGSYMQPWKFTDDQQRLNLTFTPYKERLATTRLGIIDSEVHQMFGHYSGEVVTDDGTRLIISNLLGFAEEHQARW